MRASVIVGLLSLASCATPVAEPFLSPDGQQAYLIYCGGAALSMASCHAEARKICGGNYRELNRTIAIRPMATIPTENRQIEIVCNSAN